jgi:Tfp pilus assembly protein PilV
MIVHQRSGSALIEVLMALVLLALSGTALITLLGQTAHSMRTTLESEQLARAGAAQMNRVVIVPRDSLLAHVGRHLVNGWTVDVTKISASLFAVSVAASDTTEVVLHTVLYRPSFDSTDATR